MRADIEALLERARQLAQSVTARELLRLVGELVTFAKLASEVQDAQDAYWALIRDSKASKAHRDRALARARELEGRLRQARKRLGLGRQPGLPGVGR